MKLNNFILSKIISMYNIFGMMWEVDDGYDVWCVINVLVLL